MATGYRIGGVDFDDLFDPYQSGAKSQDTGRRVNGVDLSQRYAHISFGTKRADVGYRVGGVDVSNLWAAKGTAVYFPAVIEAHSATLTGASRNASVSISIRTNGTIVVATSGTETKGAGTYTYGVSSAGFDFRISSASMYGTRANASSSATITGKGGVNVAYPSPPGATNAFDTGWVASADDANPFLTFAAFSAANAGASQIGGGAAPRNFTIEVRRKSDGVIVANGSALSVLTDSQS